MNTSVKKPLLVAAAVAVTAGILGIGVAQAADPSGTPTPAGTATKSKADLDTKKADFDTTSKADFDKMSITDYRAKNDKAMEWFEANGIKPTTVVKDGYAWIVYDEQLARAAAGVKGVDYTPQDTSKAK
jgi:hypothetical protein